MGTQNALNSIIKVAFSNIISIFSSVLVAFLLPKIFGITEYGYYKTYTLYITYVVLLTLGYIDGIYLKYSGQKYENLNYNKFSFYFKFFFFWQVIMSAAGIIISLCFFKNEFRYIACFVSLYILLGNINAYFTSLSQTIKRFKELSIRNIIRSILIICSVIIMFIMYKYSSYVITYYIYLYVFSGIYFALDIWYLITYRKSCFSKMLVEKQDILMLIKAGLPLILSNMIGTLILTVDRQFVNICFDTDTYSVYSFAYNLLALVTTATSAVSTVLFPALRDMNKREYANKYMLCKRYLLIFITLCLNIYFPLCIFISWFLPKYLDSLIIFRIVLPGLVLSSLTQVVMQNFYKLLDINLNFFIKSIIVLVISILADIGVYFVWGNTLSISIISIFVLLIWYVITEAKIVKILKTKFIKDMLYIIVMFTVFYGITFITNYYIGFVCLLFSSSIFTIIFYFSELKSVFISFKQKLKKDKNSINNC